MESFFKKLCDCENAILHETSYKTADGSRQAYSLATVRTVENLIVFVESGKFTKAKCSKFIARHFRYNADALTNMWNKEYGADKSYHTMRSQISVTSMALYDLFGTDFADELLMDNPSGVSNTLACFELGDVMFDDIFIYELADFIDKNVDRSDYDLSELSKEMKVLQRYRRDRFKKQLAGLDKSKVAYIKRILDKPLVVDHKIRQEKVELLKALHQLPEQGTSLEPETAIKSFDVGEASRRSPQNLVLSDKEFALLTQAVDIDSPVVNEKHIQELKAFLYLFYTQEGIGKYFSKFSGKELALAIKQIKEGK